MKKVLSVLILTVLLFGIAGSGLAAVGDPCCVDGDCDTGERCVGAGTPCIYAPPVLVNTGTCQVAAVGNGMEIPEGCTLRQEIMGYLEGTYIDESIDDRWGMICMLNTLYTATNWFFYVLIILSTIMIIWGAFGILFAAGDPERMTKGRTTLIYALIGIAVALFAKVIPAIVRFMMGV